MILYKTFHSGCDSTHYGANCSLECNVYCKDGCRIDSGTCYSCIEGHYGDACDKKCGAGCVSVCNRYSGDCVCKPGWQGGKCDGNRLKCFIICNHFLGN